MTNQRLNYAKLCQYTRPAMEVKKWVQFIFHWCGESILFGVAT